ncbi:hypothetical protein K493DRAFT_280708 [Basidiobolus meristosporus CBS 931.73]|uniref:K Homology domain-containing protein n=1 Tax=Basidiobolus meristosporus CBS 931.73 TaxID=1314790 RepID=A0A1Y1YJG9_9FUNG|nr:hypothetical protein K493DRAFT_280708 [Basidiobolus meristosporus CBS 931.73]|eukprot:ORX98161.1 hypothetical protein K493DRAFT_280708 [Basidiobolus meristosporus CBS 931.73]
MDSTGFMNPLQDSSLPASVQLQMLHSQVHDDEHMVNYYEDSEPEDFPVPVPKKPEAIDLDSESMFPSLTASTPATPLATSAWGSDSRVRADKSESQKKSGIVTEIYQLQATQQQRQREFGNKNATGDMIKQIMKNTRTQIDVSTSRNTGTTTFLIKGKVEDVQKAKREITSSFSLKVTTTVTIPSFCRRFVVGTRGKTLQSIIDRSGARVHLPRREEEDDQSDEEESFTDIAITGDVEGVKLAKSEIEKIVSEKTSKTTMRITHIPPEYYPLIAGPHNNFIQNLTEQMGVKVHIPPFISSEDEESNVDKSILVAGDKSIIQSVVDIIGNLYEDLQRTTKTMLVNIPKRQHKYLIGPKGANLQEILEVTGCFVELAPASDPSEAVTIRGPEAKLVEALTFVMDKANSTHVDVVDLCKMHVIDDPVQYARNALKYFLNRSKLRKIENDCHVQIMFPKASQMDKSVTLELVGKYRSHVEKSKQQVMELAIALSPAYISTCRIPAFLHRHIVGRKGQNIQRIRDTYGVDVIVPDEQNDSDEVLIVYESNPDIEVNQDKRAKNEAVRQLLDVVTKELIKAADDAKDFTVQNLNIPSRFHRLIIGTKGTTLAQIMGTDSPASVKIGSSKKGEEKSSDIDENSIVVKGPSEEVTRIVKEINRIVDEAKHHEIMNSFTAEFTIPASFSAHVIGKGGSNITKLKDSLDVKIDIDGKNEEADEAPKEKVKVFIQGTKKGVEQAKKQIMEIVDRLADQTELRLTIAPHLHKSLIGAGGRYVKRLEDTYNVRIKFPHSGDRNAENEDDSEEAQKPDEVIVKGGKKEVAEAKAEILQLIEFEQEHSHTLNFEIPARCLPHVVGRNGSKINEIKEDTSTKIDLGRPEDENDEDALVSVAIQGTKEGIAAARDAIMEVVEDQQSRVTVTMDIDPDHHKFLIGPGGSRIKELITKFGGDADSEPWQRTVRFPRSDSTSSEVVLKGDQQLVEQLRAELARLAVDLNDKTTIRFSVPADQYPNIIGRGGSVLKEIQARYEVDIQMPNSRRNGHRAGDDSDDQVKITGKHENCEKAKAEILSKLRVERKINIPAKHQSTLIDRGITLRRLRGEFNVNVDLPPLGQSRRIDDEEEDGKKRSEPTGDVVWTLKGEEKDIDEAEKYLMGLLEEARKNSQVLLVKVHPSLHRFVIGRGGATIRRIRNQTGCQIDVPKNREDEHVMLRGSQVGVEQARDMILEIIENAGEFDE